MPEQNAESVAEVQGRLNAVLHRQMGVWTPCLTACTHIIDGEWTALGAANVLARQSTPIDGDERA